MTPGAVKKYKIKRTVYDYSSNLPFKGRLHSKAFTNSKVMFVTKKVNCPWDRKIIFYGRKPKFLRNPGKKMWKRLAFVYHRDLHGVAFGRRLLLWASLLLFRRIGGRRARAGAIYELLGSKWKKGKDPEREGGVVNLCLAKKILDSESWTPFSKWTSVPVSVV